MLTKTRARNPEEILATAEAERLTRDAAAERDIRLAEERTRLAREQAQQRRDDRRTEREQQRTDRDDRRTRRQAARKAAMDAVRHRAPRVAIAVLAGIPIVAPMIVAWTGQVQIAVKVLHWPTLAGVVFAAAWESVGILAAVLCHVTRSAGDRGTVFRFAAWACASGAAAMNYGDRTDHWHPTTIGLTYGAMSLVSLAVWELVALFLHRRAQQAAGRVSPPRPHFGLLRWVRWFPLTWAAWSLSLRDDIGTIREALDAGAVVVAERDAVRQAEAAVKDAAKAERKASKDTAKRERKAISETPPETVHERPSRTRRRRTRKASTKAPRKLFTDYVSEARAAWSPDVEITPAWVQEVTNCARGTAYKVAALLSTEHAPATEGTDR